MDNEIIKTSADDLYELVKSRKKISVEDAAKILKLPLNTVHAMVDFLVEERIFGIEYKFTTPYIYISRGTHTITPRAKKNLISKKEFFKRVQNWGIPLKKINELWLKYVEENEMSIKREFYKKAYIRNIPDENIEGLWNKYLGYLK